MSELDKSYIAGLFDGEGSAHVYVKENNGSFCTIQINMVDKEPLLFIRERYGGILKLNMKSRGKPYWVFLLVDPIRGRENKGAFLRRRFLTDILPYMRNLAKIDDCKKCLEYCNRGIS